MVRDQIRACHYPGERCLLKELPQERLPILTVPLFCPNSKAMPILVFSFVGMKSQELALEGKTRVSVTLEEENIGLDEVIAIGYGSLKRSDLNRFHWNGFIR